MINTENIRGNVGRVVEAAEAVIEGGERRVGNNANTENNEVRNESAEEGERRKREEEQQKERERLEKQRSLFGRIERGENLEETFIEIGDIALNEYKSLKEEQKKLSKKQIKNKETDKIQGKIEITDRKIKHLEEKFNFQDISKAEKAEDSNNIKQEKIKLGESIYKTRQDILDKEILANENETIFREEFETVTSEEEQKPLKIKIEKTEKEQLRIKRLFELSGILNILDFERREEEVSLAIEKQEKRQKNIEKSRDRGMEDLLRSEELPEDERAIWVEGTGEDGIPISDRLSPSAKQIENIRKEMSRDFQKRRMRDVAKRSSLGFGITAMSLVIGFYDLIGKTAKFLMDIWGVKWTSLIPERKKKEPTKKKKEDSSED